MSQSQSDSTHPIGKFAGTASIELATQKTPDFRRPGMELLRQHLDGISLADQTRFKVVKVARQRRGDDLGRDGFLADAEAGLEGTIEVLGKLQRGCQPGGHQTQGRGLDQGICVGIRLSALGEQPVQAGTGVFAETHEGQDVRAVSDLLHGRTVQIVSQLRGSDQYHGPAAAPSGDHFHQPFEVSVAEKCGMTARQANWCQCSTFRCYPIAKPVLEISPDRGMRGVVAA